MNQTNNIDSIKFSLRMKITLLVLLAPVLLTIYLSFDSLMFSRTQLNKEAQYSILTHKLHSERELQNIQEKYYQTCIRISNDIQLIVPLNYNVTFQVHKFLSDTKERENLHSIAILDSTGTVINCDNSLTEPKLHSDILSIPDLTKREFFIIKIDGEIYIISVVNITYKDNLLGFVVATKELLIQDFNQSILILSQEQFYEEMHDEKSEIKLQFNNATYNEIKQKKFVLNHNKYISSYQISDYNNNEIGSIFFTIDFTRRVKAMNVSTAQRLVFMLVITITSILSAIFLSNKIVKPISILARITYNISNKNFSDEPDFSTNNDEIGYLTNSYIAMIRTLKTTYEQLKKSRKEAYISRDKAEQANRVKREFLANMSHEIRTPMNGIIGTTDLLLETNLNEEQRKYAKITKSTSNNLLEIINDILDFSKIEAGKLEIENIEFNIIELMDSFTQSISSRMEAKGLQFISYLTPDIPEYIIGDPGRIRQILNNLVGNALKFTSKGQIIIFCKLVEESPNSLKLKFSIIDSGIGISKEVQKKLFQKFTQADGSTSRKYGGTGLGLTISKQLSELMGGEIGVESEPHKGSKFWFTLKVEKVKIPTAQRDCSKFEKLNVLVINDNPAILNILGLMLTTLKVNHKLISSNIESVKTALHCSSDKPLYNTIICDDTLLSENMNVIFRQVKRIGSTHHTHFAILSSLDNHKQISSYKELGVDSFIAKPTNQSDIYDFFAVITGNINLSKSTTKVKQTTISKIDVKVASNYRLLLVDDNKINRIIARTILNKLGFTVDEAVDGLDAVNILKTKKYHLVFMDLQMPNLDGFEATKAIRQKNFYQANRKVPVVAMTANAMEGVKEKCFSVGIDDYVTKPISKKELVRVINTWVN